MSSVAAEALQVLHISQVTYKTFPTTNTLSVFGENIIFILSNALRSKPLLQRKHRKVMHKLSTFAPSVIQPGESEGLIAI